jgi:uncharacterized Tic20 family protein
MSYDEEEIIYEDEEYEEEYEEDHIPVVTLNRAGPPIPNDVKQWAMLCHLSALAGLVIPIPGINLIVPFLLWNAKKDEHSFIDEEGKEAVNFQISITIYGIVSILLILLLIGIPMTALVILAGIILPVLSAIKAKDGISAKYPLTLRFLK